MGLGGVAREYQAGRGIGIRLVVNVHHFMFSLCLVITGIVHHHAMAKLASANCKCLLVVDVHTSMMIIIF